GQVEHALVDAEDPELGQTLEQLRSGPIRMLEPEERKIPGSGSLPSDLIGSRRERGGETAWRGESIWSKAIHSGPRLCGVQMSFARITATSQPIAPHTGN